jgi:hypothetical protein
MAWKPFALNPEPGARGSEGGLILRDDAHELGARITLEQDGGTAPFAITCGIYGWFFHTRFLGSEVEASAEYIKMREGLTAIIKIIPRAGEGDESNRTERVFEAIKTFVAEFP